MKPNNTSITYSKKKTEKINSFSIYFMFKKSELHPNQWRKEKRKKEGRKNKTDKKELTSNSIGSDVLFSTKWKYKQISKVYTVVKNGDSEFESFVRLCEPIKDLFRQRVTYGENFKFYIRLKTSSGFLIIHTPVSVKDTS